MKITCVFVRYPDSYPGQHAPELYAAVDEWLNDDNPDYLAGKVTEARQMLVKGDLADYAVADIIVSDEWVDGLFARPVTRATPAE